MTNRFAGAFDPPDPATLGTPVVQSVQSSLYQRLRRSKGGKAGSIAWLLVRAGTPKHAAHGEAMTILEGLSAGALAELLAVVRGSGGSPLISGRAACAELVRGIEAVLVGLHDAALPVTEAEASAAAAGVASAVAAMRDARGAREKKGEE